MFGTVQRSIVGQFKKQRNQFDSRWRDEHDLWNEKQATQKAAQGTREVALGARIFQIENQVQVLSSSLEYTTLHNRDQLGQGIANSGTSINSVNMYSLSSISNVHNVVPAPNPRTVPEIASLPVPRLSAGIGMNGCHASDFGQVVEPPKYDGKSSNFNLKLSRGQVVGTKRVK